MAISDRAGHRRSSAVIGSHCNRAPLGDRARGHDHGASTDALVASASAEPDPCAGPRFL